MKSINVMNMYTDYTLKNLKKISKKCLEKYYSENLFNDIYSTYLEARYNNNLDKKRNGFYNNVEYHLQNRLKNIDKNLQNEKEKNSLLVYETIMLADTSEIDIDKFSKEMEEYRKKYLELENKDFAKEFSEEYKKFLQDKENFLEQFVNKSFECSYYNTNIRKVYNARIDYNFKFPKLYSEYAVQRVYNDGIIAEDKTFILCYNVCSKVINEIKAGIFNTNYLVNFPCSLFEKKEKLGRLLNIIDSDNIKERITLKLTFNNFSNHKNEILNLINTGFNFSLEIDETYTNTIENKKLILGLFKYIIISSGNENIKHFLEYDNVIKTK